jgi:hypothetical protein
MTGIKERGDIAVCIYQLGKALTNQQYKQTQQDFLALHIEVAEWFDKSTTFC